MTLLIIFEVIKMLGWAAILVLAIVYRKKIRADFFWLKILASVLMIAGGIDDIINTSVLIEKSSWWLYANIFIITLYLDLIYKDVKMKKEVESLKDKMKADFKEIINEHKKCNDADITARN